MPYALSNDRYPKRKKQLGGPYIERQGKQVLVAVFITFHRQQHIHASFLGILRAWLKQRSR